VPAAKLRPGVRHEARGAAERVASATAPAATEAVPAGAAGSTGVAPPKRRDAAGATGEAPRGGTVVVPVDFSDRSTFLSVYHRDLAAGTLFVSTDVPAALKQVVMVELLTPPPVRRTLHFRAEVARR